MFDDVDVVALLDGAPDAVIVVGADGVIRDASAAVYPLVGYRPDELVGAPLSSLLPEDLVDVHEAHRARFVRHPAPRPMGQGLELHARRRDGVLVPVEVALVPVPGGDGTTAAFVRDDTHRRSLVDRLVARSEVVTAMAKGEPLEAIMQLAARHARQMVSADACWVSLVDAPTRRLRVIASDQDSGPSIVGSSLAIDDSVVAPHTGHDAVIVDVTRGATAFRAPGELGYRSMLAVRIGNDSVRGVVAAARRPDRCEFADADLDAARQFASLVQVALDLAEARAELDEVARQADHERIARDLHDTVIQRLFAEGLQLGAVAMDAPPHIAERLGRIATNLDEVISGIRDTIFQLQPRAGVHDLRRSVTDLTARYAEPAALIWTAEFLGDTDGTPPELLGQMLTVLRECLANTVRHAAATRVDVTVLADGESLALVVADDGVGPASDGSGGLGLVNLQARAIELGGTFSIKRGAQGGAVVRWRVPCCAQ